MRLRTPFLLYFSFKLPFARIDAANLPELDRSQFFRPCRHSHSSQDFQDLFRLVPDEDGDLRLASN